MIESHPYSARSARHHFRNYLGIIRGFSEILMEGLPPDDSSLPHFDFIVTTTDRIQTFVDRVISNEEILTRHEWKKPFWINVEHDIKSILKTVEALRMLQEKTDLKNLNQDLLKIKSSAKEILSYSEEFINRSFDPFLDATEE